MVSIDRALRRLRASIAPTRPGPPAADPDFDADFYLAHHGDLAGMTPSALHQHFHAHGRAEGRPGVVEAYYAALEREHGPLPADFDPVVYREMHADVAAQHSQPWRAAHHYLTAGRREKRPYATFDAELYRSLYFERTVITDYELKLDYDRSGREAGRVGSWAQLLKPHGLGAAWVDRLKVDEFELLNRTWCGPVATRLQAVRLMLEGGLERLAPIAFDLVFDPAHHRDAHPDLAALGDVALYRRWLGRGVGAGEAPDAVAALKALRLDLSAYPVAFDWARFAATAAGASAAQGAPADGRWAALRRLVRDHVVGDPPPPLVPGAPAQAFLAAYGRAMRGVDEAAVLAALEAAWAWGDGDPALAHDLADAHFRAARWSSAAGLFQRAARAPSAQVWTFANGAVACARSGRMRAALALLRRSREAYAGEPAWREAAARVIELDFHLRTRHARRHYRREGGRATADALVAAAVERVGALWAELDPFGAPLPAAAGGRVVMLANFGVPVCTHYRIEQKRELFEQLGRSVEIYRLDELDAFLSALPGAQAAIFFRLEAWPGVVRAMQAARNLEVPTYYEMDDLTFDAKEFPDTLESYDGLLTAAQYEALQFGVPLTRAAIALCDYGISSTFPLARALQAVVRTGEVFWLPNGLDSRNQFYLDEPPLRVRRSDDIVIAYASGTLAHNSDFHQLATPAIVELLKANRKVKFLLVGYLVLTPEYDEVRDQIIRFDYVNGSAAFWSLLADADINIAVLKSTWATDSKSEIKWLEAAVMGVPSVVSDTAMYREVLDDGVDGLIARTPDDWRRALGLLVADADLRRRIGAAARAKAAREYSLEANARRLDALLGPALERRPGPDERRGPPRESRRPRILLCNVWFPPQTIGGATRVLRDNLDAWLDAGLDREFEFLVVASDHDAAPAHRTRVDRYRGVPVVRFSTPMRPDMDWEGFDPRVGALYAELIDAWKPDLAHFHAVQRLTASVVEETRLAGVPYLCTVHDAWWLSDWHFLTDEEGRPQPPGEDLPRNPPRGRSVSESLERRRVLKRALAGAEHVLAVSDSFAELHRACGVERVLSVPNGAPPLPATARIPSASGRVRLAHVGNVAKHKGFHLVQAALRQGAFANLELTVVDHGAPAGSERVETWGATPVRVIGKVAPSRIHELYARTDVLLAPSTWPESFGLVAREALNCGCWVVAGDRGAMGEDVTPGVNGFVVDVSTPLALVEALAAVDADPARYTRPPASRPTLRSADDQARELVALYRDVLARRPADHHTAEGRPRGTGRARTPPAPPAARPPA